MFQSGVRITLKKNTNMLHEFTQINKGMTGKIEFNLSNIQSDCGSSFPEREDRLIPFW